jgi:hypothetical protein
MLCMFVGKPPGKRVRNCGGAEMRVYDKGQPFQEISGQGAIVVIIGTDSSRVGRNLDIAAA